jgi:hypothetical protein
MDRDITAAAIERLEAEKRRRLEERVAKGEIVRVPLGDSSPGGLGCVVVGGPEEADEQLELAKAAKIAELRKAGETREVIFDAPEDAITVIITGVPHAPDSYNPLDLIAEEGKACPEAFNARRQVNEALSAVRNPPPRTPAPASAEEPADLVDHRIHVQVAPPTEDSPGAVIEGSYTLAEDGTLRVYDTDQNLLGTERLRPDADAGAVARRVLRTKKGPDEFWGRSLH